MDVDELDAVLIDMHEQSGVELTVLGKTAEGESDKAIRVVDVADRNLILKRSSPERAQRAQATTHRLRLKGYPAPTYERIVQLDDDAWVLMAEMPGRPLVALTAALVDQLLVLLDHQAGEAFLPSDEPSIVDTLLLGGKGYALHDTMRAYSSETSQLLDEVLAVGRRFKDLDYPNTDIVHYDLNPANVLALDGQITGIVDWEGTRTGDRAFDIATLLFYAGSDQDAEALLKRALLENAGAGRASVYIAHMILRQVEWSARYHDASTLQHHIRRSTHLLQGVRTWQA